MAEWNEPNTLFHANTSFTYISPHVVIYGLLWLTLHMHVRKKLLGLLVRVTCFTFI